MTVIIKFGRRVPKSLKSRMIQKIESIIGVQEHIWLLLSMTFNNNKKKFQEYKKGKFKPILKGRLDEIDVTREKESEDLFYNIEWLTITIQGDKDAELDELQGINKIYDQLGKILKDRKISKSDFNPDANLSKRFATNAISEEELTKSFEAGKRQTGEKSVQNMLLEMGIITNIQHIEDYEVRTHDVSSRQEAQHPAQEPMSIRPEYSPDV